MSKKAETKIGEIKIELFDMMEDIQTFDRNTKSEMQNKQNAYNEKAKELNELVNNPASE